MADKELGKKLLAVVEEARKNNKEEYDEQIQQIVDDYGLENAEAEETLLSIMGAYATQAITSLGQTAEEAVADTGKFLNHLYDNFPSDALSVPVALTIAAGGFLSAMALKSLMNIYGVFKGKQSSGTPIVRVESDNLEEGILSTLKRIFTDDKVAKAAELATSGNDAEDEDDDNGNGGDGDVGESFDAYSLSPVLARLRHLSS